MLWVYTSSLFVQAFDCVSIMFCELVDDLSPTDTVQGVMDVVTSMNSVFSMFDQVLDQYHVFKVSFNSC